MINISHDYKVLITPFSYHHSIVKLIILLNDCNELVLPISLGNHRVLNKYSTLQGYKPNNTTHAGPGAPRVAIIHDMTKRSGWVLPPLVSSSTCLPRRTRRGWPEHYPIVDPWSEVRYRPTHRHTKLPSLGIPYIPYVPVHNSNLLTGARWSVFNWLRQGLPPWSSEYQIRPLSFLPIQYSPLSPNCFDRSLIMPTIWSPC
jgi:hypothetical protein